MIVRASFKCSSEKISQVPKDKLPDIAFIGRSNVGKSSLINMLTQHKGLAKVSATPGKTRLINHFTINDSWDLVDLPGYGYAKVPKAEKERWAKLIESYFAHPDYITLGVLIVDARHKPTADDVTMCDWFRGTGCPMIVVANKLDKLKKSQVEPALALIRETLELTDEDVLVPFSAEKGITGHSSGSSRSCRITSKLPRIWLFFTLSSLLATTMKGHPLSINHLAMVMSLLVGA